MATFDTFDARDALKHDTLEIRIVGVRQMQWRLRIAAWLICLAAKIAGVGNVTIEEAFDAVKDGD
jgi:hypothetical protein